MGPKSLVSVEEAVNALKKHIKYFISPEKPSWSSEVWKLISKDLKYKWNVESVRTNVRNDRRNILTIALKESGYFTDPPSTEAHDYKTETNIENVDSCSSNDEEYDDPKDPDYCHDGIFFDNSDNLEEFDVEICREVWSNIVLQVNDEDKQNLKLKKKAWTHTIAYTFWEQYRLPCAFIFDSGNISVNGKHYMTIKGHCKSKKCGNRLLGFIDEAPSEIGPVFIKIQCIDTRHADTHEDLQRPLQGEQRKIEGKKIKDLGVHGYRRQVGAKLLRPGNTGCPFLHNPNVLHQAKKEFIDSELGITPNDRKDTFSAISGLRKIPIYNNSIHKISQLPFIVIYTTQSQMHCYKEYRRLHKKYSSICIDATGGVVRQITIEGNKSSYIFLYQIVINFDKSSQSIYQMISDKHTADYIALWLRLWIALGAKPPHEAVSDGNRAQLNAISLAFNEMSLKQYIKVCFEKIRNPDEDTVITTYIRLDSAHFVHAFTGWSCFKSVIHSSIKQFYTYCFCLLIDCKDLDKFERILLLLLIVCNTAYEDSIIIVKDETITPLDARKELENLISTRNIEKFFLNVSEQIEKFNLDEKPSADNPQVTNKEISSSISKWASEIIKAASNQIIEGKKIHSFFLPSLVKQIIDVIMEFPLWTNICIPCTDLRATSCYVEEDFKDLKTALKLQVPLPTDAYTFLKLHLDYLIGGVSLMKLKVTKFVATNFNNRTNNKPDLLNCNLSKIDEKVENNTCDINIEESHDYAHTNVDGALINSNENFEKNCISDNVGNVNQETSILNWNLSKVTDEKNEKEPYENWMGKGKDNNFNKFGWMNSKTIETEEVLLNSSVDRDAEQVDNEILMEKLSISSERESLYHIYNEDYFYDEKLQDYGDEKITINEIIVSDDYTEKNDIVDQKMCGMNDEIFNYEILKNIKVEKVDDHNYSFKTSTPLSNEKQKRTLSEAIEKVTRKKRNCGKYFQDNVAINVQNNFVVPEKKNTDKKIIKKNIKYVLQNGFRCKAIKYNDYDWLPQNTCPFDTIIQLLFESTLQDIVFFDFCKNSKNDMFKFLVDFKKNGVTNGMYEKRFKILYPIYKNTETSQKKIKKEDGKVVTIISRTIFCQDNINLLWNKLFVNEPSLVEKNICPTPGCKNNNTRNVPTFPINYKLVIERGFGILDKALDFHSVIHNMSCAYCKGNKRIRQQFPNNYIYIELDIKTQSEVEGRECKLRDIPTYLSLSVTNEDNSTHNLRYRLCGVAGYSPGHYVAYCRRISGVWLLYNDLVEKPESKPNSSKVLPHGVLYVRC